LLFNGLKAASNTKWLLLLRWFETGQTGGATRYIRYIDSPGGLVAIIESDNGNHRLHYLAKVGINVLSMGLKANPFGLGISLTIGVLNYSGQLR
jgi:hypothetical protein